MQYAGLLRRRDASSLFRSADQPHTLNKHWNPLLCVHGWEWVTDSLIKPGRRRCNYRDSLRPVIKICFSNWSLSVLRLGANPRSVCVRICSFHKIFRKKSILQQILVSLKSRPYEFYLVLFSLSRISVRSGWFRIHCPPAFNGWFESYLPLPGNIFPHTEIFKLL